MKAENFVIRADKFDKQTELLLPKIITFRLQVQGKMIFSTCIKTAFR